MSLFDLPYVNDSDYSDLLGGLKISRGRYYNTKSSTTPEYIHAPGHNSFGLLQLPRPDLM
jgi:hypothetical protein